MNNKELLALLLITFLYIIFPGQISWINDEALLLSTARNLNLNGQIGAFGLVGSKDIVFGSFPLLFYQAILLLTSNLILIVQIKTLIFVLIIYNTSKIILKELNLDSSLFVVPLLSPFIFHNARLLWDNCFLIPLSFAIFALILNFKKAPSSLKLLTISFLVILLIQTHLISILLILPLGFYFLFNNLAWLRKNYLMTASAILLVFICNFSYLASVLSNLKSSDAVTDITFFLSGAFYFTSLRFFETFIPEIFEQNTSFIYLSLNILTASAVIFFIAQILIIAKKQIQKEANSFADLISVFCLIAILIACIISSLLKLESYPHYLNTISILFLIPILTYLNKTNKNIRKLYIASLFCSIICFQAFIILNHGTKSLSYGATLSNQLNIAGKVKSFGESVEIITTVTNYKLFPHSLAILVRDFSARADQKLPTKKILIEYSDISTINGEIKLTRVE